MSMKHTFKTVSTVLVALGMTVCSVTALATNASAANDTNKNAPDSVGYTVDTSHNFDHQSSTDSTSVEGVTREPYSMAERPYYDRVYYSEAVFKDDAYSSIYFRQDSSLPYRFFTVIKNVPASDDPYMFYIQYKENPNTDPYIEATIDWDSINYTKVMKGGKYYAFKVTQQSDVTIEWDCYDNYVNAYGSNCYMVNSNTSVTEDVTYPTETFTATQPTTEVPVIYEDTRLINCSVSAYIHFKNNAAESCQLTEAGTKMTGTIKNVPGSSAPYYFVIPYTATHASGIYYGTKSDGNKLYEDKGGVYFAFFNTSTGDVNFEWDKANPDSVKVTGNSVTMMKSQIPFTGDINENITEPYTTPSETVTHPTEIPIYTSAPQPATTVEVASSAEQPTTAVVSYTLGDANLDGVININDATLVQRFVAKIYNPNEIQKFVADADKDGVITIKDATLIQKIVAKVK